MGNSSYKLDYNLEFYKGWMSHGPHKIKNGSTSNKMPNRIPDNYGLHDGNFMNMTGHDWLSNRNPKNMSVYDWSSDMKSKNATDHGWLSDASHENTMDYDKTLNEMAEQKTDKGQFEEISMFI